MRQEQVRLDGPAPKCLQSAANASAAQAAAQTAAAQVAAGLSTDEEAEWVVRQKRRTIGERKLFYKTFSSDLCVRMNRNCSQSRDSAFVRLTAEVKPKICCISKIWMLISLRLLIKRTNEQQTLVLKLVIL